MVMYYSLAPLYAGSVTGPMIAAGAVTEAKITLANNTTNDASITKHGFLLKGDNNTAHFMRGDCSWSALPASAQTIEYIETLTGDGANPTITGSNAAYSSYAYLLIFYHIVKNAAGQISVNLTLNNVTSADYLYKYLTAVAVATGAGNNFPLTDYHNTGDAPLHGFLVVEVAKADGKLFISNIGAAYYTDTNNTITGIMRAAANLSRFDFVGSGGAFAATSVIKVYGVKGA